MRRIASHYVYWKQLLRMHYVELDEKENLVGVFPLNGEIAGTEFYDGILVPALAEGEKMDRQGIEFSWAGNKNSLGIEFLTAALQKLNLPKPAEKGLPTQVLLVTLPLTSAKLSADNSRCNGYIKRL
ncbi:MAG: hypothetical protein J6B46_07570 [Parabacteroides sp.]|nr:hypothetical protein [Parabacteroides sp.]